MKLATLPDTIKTGPSSAMLKAVCTWVQTLLGEDVTFSGGKFVSVRPVPSPPPIAGQWHIVTHPMSIGNESGEANYVNLGYTVGVTASVKTSSVPADRDAIGWMLGDGQALELMDHLIGPDGLHGNYDVMKIANDCLTADGSPLLFSVPLLFLSATWSERGPDWFASFGANGTRGYSCTAVFGRAAVMRGY